MRYHRPSTVFALCATLAIAAGGCGPTDAVGGNVDRSDNTIVGGEAFVGLPAVGSLVRYGSQHCTATVIAPRKLITAAHCVVGVSPSSLQFAIGPSLSQVEAVVSVAAVTPHPDYDASTIANDIATVTLASDAPVGAMPVATDLGPDDVGVDALFVGYGVSNGFAQSGSGVKRAVYIPIAQLGSTQIAYATSGKNTCNGDSGGPAFVERDGELHIAGVTSYGDQFCQQFGVNTRADTYLEFLGVFDDTPADDGCGGETFTGRCDGNTVVWCEGGQVHSGDCSPHGLSCGFNQGKGYYSCL